MLFALNTALMSPAELDAVFSPAAPFGSRYGGRVGYGEFLRSLGGRPTHPTVAERGIQVVDAPAVTGVHVACAPSPSVPAMSLAEANMVASSMLTMAGHASAVPVAAAHSMPTMNAAGSRAFIPSMPSISPPARPDRSADTPADYRAAVQLVARRDGLDLNDNATITAGLCAAAYRASVEFPQLHAEWRMAGHPSLT